MRLRQFVCVTLVLAMFFSLLSGCNSDNGNRKTVSTGTYKEISSESGELNSGIVFQNEYFAVEWQKENKRVVFHDLKNNTQYSSTPSDAIAEQTDENGGKITNNPKINSAITVTHFSSSSLIEITLNSEIGAVKNGNVQAQVIDDGIRVIYDFVESQITVPVDYTVKDKYFSVSVNPEEICDNGKDYVTRVSIAPYMCGIKNESETEDYLFLPDGSGAIIKPKTLDSVGVNGEIPVYGGDKAIGQMLYNTYTEQCYLPVYGMKAGNKGLCAIISSSAERAFVDWEVGSANLKFSSVYSTFNIRGYNLIERPGGFAAYSPHLKVFNENISSERLTVNYYPIYGEDCGYNDMANIYRDYLKENNLLDDGKEENIYLSLELIGGIEEKKFFCGIPYSGMTALTSVNEANEIVEHFGKLTDGLAVRLCGFTQSGLDVGKVAGGFEISSKLGNKNDITELLKTCRENNVEISLDFDTTSFNKSGNGYSLKKSAARFSDYELNLVSMYNPVTRNSNGTEYGLISRNLLSSVVEKTEKSVDAYGFDFIGVGTLGKLCYSDYARPETYNCDGVQEDTAAILKKLSGNKKVVMTGANDYAVAFASHIAGAPICSSDYDVISYDIPFYSMVFKGYRAMSSGGINTASDSEYMILKCIESGIAPTYNVIYNFPQSAITSKYAVTRSAYFKNIGNDIENTISYTAELYKKISGKKIVSHTVLNDGLRAVKYSDGITVYVNFGDTAQVIDGITINEHDFTLIGG